MTQLMTTAGHDRALAPGRRLLVVALLLGSRLLTHLATRLTERASRGQASSGREFHVVEQDGHLVGLVYDNGRLIATLPGVGRL